jgi:hypothetical protein
MLNRTSCVLCHGRQVKAEEDATSAADIEKGVTNYLLLLCEAHLGEKRRRGGSESPSVNKTGGDD